jgi:hypothetical protein
VSPSTSYSTIQYVYSLLTVGNFEGGGWLGNGTLIDYGGNPQESVPSGSGVMGIRLYTPQANGVGEIWEDPSTIHLATNRRVRNLLYCKTLNFSSYQRWYPSSARISDGSQIIFGGALAGGFNNIPSHDNPTVRDVLVGCNRRSWFLS